MLSKWLQFARVWVGMWLVLKGELTLGMLIALELLAEMSQTLSFNSRLYQGFQGVQLAMERLSDILDQNPELSSEDDLNQIFTANSRFYPL